MKHTGFLIGHSFVSGLHHHLSAESVAHALQISDFVANFHLYDIPGGKRTLPSNTIIETSKVDFVIMNFGSNDTASGADPLP